MNIIDSKGRLFGKLSLLDLGAALVILAVIIGVFVFPGTQVTSVAQINEMKPIEVDLIVRGLSVQDPQLIGSQFDQTNKTKIIIRNQPYGEVEIINYEFLPREVIVPQPDGSVKALPDPRPQGNYSTDMLMTIGGEAKITPDGAVLGNNKVKIGTTIELEGQNYNFNSSVINVRY